MGRLGLRVLMALVGVSVLVFYGLAALLTYWLLVTVWVNRPPLATSVVYLLLLTLLFGYASYQFGTTRLLHSLDAIEIPPDRLPTLHDRVARMTDRMGIDTPRLYVADMALPNAMSLGGARRGAIVLDRSLFRMLTDEELEGILAHELAHLENRDGLVQTLAYSFMRTVAGLATFVLLPLLLFVAGVARAVAWIRGRPARWSENALGQFHQLVQQSVAIIFLVFTLLVRAHSRRREFAADDRAAEVTGRPLSLARALAKIERIADPDWGLLSPLYTRGDEDNALADVLATHPATDDRIDRLVERANGDGHRVRVQPRGRNR